MDPTVTLARMLELSKAIEDDDGDPNSDTYLGELDMAETAQELAELVRDLDIWITKGGFLPSQWKPK